MTYPTDEQIDEVLRKTGGDPRKLAVAYLRAQKRFRESDEAFRAMEVVASISTAAINMDPKAVKEAEDAVEKFKRRQSQKS